MKEIRPVAGESSNPWAMREAEPTGDDNSQPNSNAQFGRMHPACLTGR